MKVAKREQRKTEGGQCRSRLATFCRQGPRYKNDSKDFPVDQELTHAVLMREPSNSSLELSWLGERPARLRMGTYMIIHTGKKAPEKEQALPAHGSNHIACQLS